MTDRLVAVFKERMRRFTEEGDASRLLDPAAIEETINLRRSYVRGGSKAEQQWDVLAILANVYLARWQVLPEDKDRDDALVALALCEVLATIDPAAVPDQIQRILEGRSLNLSDEMELLARMGRRAFEEYERTNHPGVLDAAINAMRDAASLTYEQHNLRAGRLSDLGRALFTRFQLLGDEEQPGQG